MNAQVSIMHLKSILRSLALSAIVFLFCSANSIGQDQAVEAAPLAAPTKADSSPISPPPPENTPTAQSKKSRLRLINGDYVDGQLSVLTTPGRLAWDSPIFSSPLEMDVAAVASIDIPVNVEPLPRDVLQSVLTQVIGFGAN
jgi:hypothetical protein